MAAFTRSHTIGLLLRATRTSDSRCASVNVSPLQFKEADFLRKMQDCVTRTGINPQHEDLKNVLWRNPGNLGLPGNAGDPGYNFLEGSSDVTDTFGHGTHVSGIIAAQANNTAGIAGIASGINVKLMILSTASNSLGGEPPNNAFCFMQSLNYVLQAKRAGVNIVAVNNS